MITRYLTRKAREADLMSQDIGGEALQCLLRDSAAERHESRVGYAVWAAEEHYLKCSSLARGEVSECLLQIAAGAVLWADVLGIGGRDGVDGASTRRHPAFGCCGKGRKQATDGAAWSAAIRRAAERSLVQFAVNQNGGWLALVAKTTDTDADADAEVLIDEGLVPRPWTLTIVREGLRRSAGLRPWHSEVNFAAPRSSLPVWAELLNSIVSREPEGIVGVITPREPEGIVE